MSSVTNASGTVPQSTTGGATNPIAIASSTNTTPIHVLTSVAQDWSLDGDTVLIEGHLVNTAANGLWQIAVVNSQEIVLIGSVGNGVGGATGYAYDYGINPLVTIPSDGDLANGNSVNPALQGIFNTAPFLYERVGRYRLHQSFSSAVTGGGLSLGTTWSTTTILSAPSGSGTFTQTPLVSANGFISSIANGIGLMYLGDILQISFTLNASYVQPALSALSTPFTMASIALSISIAGVSAGAYLPITGSEVGLPTISTASTPCWSVPVTLLASLVGASNGAGGVGQAFDIGLIGRNYYQSGSIAINLTGPNCWTINQYRPNG